jgi:hypothetical protein
MKSYVSEIYQLLENVNDLENLYTRCHEDFDKELPKAVRDQRKQRAAASQSKSSTHNLKRPAMLGSNKPGHLARPKSIDLSIDENVNTIYDMITINCKYKRPIKELLSQLKSIQKNRKSLEDKYSEMRKEVFKMKQIKLYKPVRGDVVDEMFAGYLNKAKLTIDV